ncbi:hypothetical protein LCGC14_0916410 [marine sediment metagenome]|uniref:HNH nuclease domain-containing protein n=1 Tax=marine sediment metagenome TaxID=412755 RepID=A0A0F9NWX2_9ZZZZ
MPFPASAQSKGGQVTAKVLREKAIREYHQEPNYCGHCGEAIEVKEGQKICEVRKKRFCTRSCAQRHNNKHRHLHREKKECATCAADMTNLLSKEKSRAHCPDCQGNFYAQKTKVRHKKVGKKQKRDSNFKEVGWHARYTLDSAGRPKQCTNCGYDVYVEAAHIKPVRNFTPTTTLSTINKLSNLAYLCKNCHWEYDHGHLQKKSFLK